MLAARTNDKIHRVIVALSSTVFVWSVLMGNDVIQCADPEPGFEPRDSSAEAATPEIIEERDLDLTRSTEAAPELAETMRPDLTPICETCSECDACKYIPPVNITKPIFPPEEFIMLFSSQERKSFVEAFHEGVMERAIWRAGLKPLRLWHKKCTVVVSLFRGPFRACNCGARPAQYQLVLGGIDELFAEDKVEITCERDLCTINVKASEEIVWFGYDTSVEPLLRKLNEEEEEAGGTALWAWLLLPAFSVQVHSQYVRYDMSNSEIYHALNRTQIRQLSDQLLDILGGIQMYNKKRDFFIDVKRFLEAKFDGMRPWCVMVGDQEPPVQTFDKFFALNKTR